MVKNNHIKLKKPPDWSTFLSNLARDKNIAGLENFLDYFQAHDNDKYRHLANFTKCCIHAVNATQQVGLPVRI